MIRDVPCSLGTIHHQNRCDHLTKYDVWDPAFHGIDSDGFWVPIKLYIGEMPIVIFPPCLLSPVVQTQLSNVIMDSFITVDPHVLFASRRAICQKCRMKGL